MMWVKCVDNGCRVCLQPLSTVNDLSRLLFWARSSGGRLPLSKLYCSRQLSWQESRALKDQTYIMRKVWAKHVKQVCMAACSSFRRAPIGVQTLFPRVL
jgi:hypothetical protein